MKDHCNIIDKLVYFVTFKIDLLKKGLNTKQVHVVCTKIKQVLRFSKA
jgi:hypothetical protein